MKKNRSRKKRIIYKGGNNIKYYLIHGPNEKRKQLMLEQFSKFGIDNSNVTWMEGLNRDSLTKEIMELVCTNEELTPANISVVLNHYMALRNMVKNNYTI